jgi:hypothetical protein
MVGLHDLPLGRLVSHEFRRRNYGDKQDRLMLNGESKLAFDSRNDKNSENNVKKTAFPNEIIACTL